MLVLISGDTRSSRQEDLRFHDRVKAAYILVKVCGVLFVVVYSYPLATFMCASHFCADVRSACKRLPI